MDWDLRTCARKGHVTYRPDETDLSERLQAQTPEGEAWRCLRCGDFVLGPAAGRGPAGDAPTILRGRALRDAFVLRLLAAERAVRGIVLLLIAYAIVRFKTSQASLRQLFEADLPAAKPLADRLNLDLNDSVIVRSVRHALEAKPSTLTLVALALFAYAAIELIEAVGLWLLKRWGEYFTVVATAAFLPLEVYELIEKVTITRVGAFIINVAAVIYLVLSKRLFGARGGGEAFEAERRSASLLEVKEAGRA
ncbi:MAG: DUF2127 domain-containing protein [Actinomycetota bacterium]|nr:DUF2127 domain-containing protein [Actinomycetota bacterium]